MEYIGISTLDKQNRVVLTKLFPDTDVPLKVKLTIDPDKKRIIIKIDDNVFGEPISVDAKSRMVIPKWVRKKYNCDSFYLGLEKKGKKLVRFLVPCED